MSLPPTRRWRRLSAFVQLALFAFSASTSLLPCATEMSASATGQATTAHHAAASPASDTEHASHMSHGAVIQDAPESMSAAHQVPASSPPSNACPWVVGCTGMVQFAFDATWRLLETAPVVSAPIGVTLRAVYAERDVESPPPRV